MPLNKQGMAFHRLARATELIIEAAKIDPRTTRRFLGGQMGALSDSWNKIKPFIEPDGAALKQQIADLTAKVTALTPDDADKAATADIITTAAGLPVTPAAPPAQS